MNHPIIVVVGKESVRATEIPHLEAIGRAIAIRGKTLIIPKNAGAPGHVAKGYTEAGGTVEYMTRDNYEDITTSNPVLAFTDTKYQAILEVSAPWHKTSDWQLIHNPKATAEAAAYITKLLEEYPPIHTSPLGPPCAQPCPVCLAEASS
jgi:hypothetical protein